MTLFPLRESPKPQHKRSKLTAKQRGHIPDKVRRGAAIRSQGRCEWCGWVNGSYDATGRKWGLQCSHLVRRWKLDETTVNDVAFLCGPSVNSGTCHNKVDYTEAGRLWALEFQNKLMEESK